MDCKITSSKKTEIYHNVQSVTLPAHSGQMQILPGHAEAFLLLQKGQIALQEENGSTKTIPVPTGECYVKDDLVTIIL